MTDPFPTMLVTPAQFHAAITNSSLTQRIIPVAAGRATVHSDSYRKRHIPGSVFFDMDSISDTVSPYPQMLPSASHFAACIGELGIRPDDIIVVYDAFDVGIYSSPRVAWMFRIFGHETVHVLNNFRIYAEQGYRIAQGEMQLLSSLEYPVPEKDTASVITFEELRDIISQHSGKYQIVDSRIAGRFTGLGHMPGAINIPLASMLDSESQGFLPVSQLKALFENAGIHEHRPMVLTCNSGVTAAALDLALRETGYENTKQIYDGSWSEWEHRAIEPELIVKDV